MSVITTTGRNRSAGNFIFFLMEFRSVAYLAPEMLKRTGHGKAVDWYLLGVVLYELLVGLPPYYADSKEELFENIEKAPLQIPSYVSAKAQSLLKQVFFYHETKIVIGERPYKKDW
jgi:serine/threonine protein kinase